MFLLGTLIGYEYQVVLVPRTLLTTMQTLGTCRYFPITLGGRSVAKCGVEGRDSTYAEFAFPTFLTHFQAPDFHRRLTDRLLAKEGVCAKEKLSLQRGVLLYPISPPSGVMLIFN